MTPAKITQSLGSLGQDWRGIQTYLTTTPWWSRTPVTTLPLSILSHMRSWLCCFIDCIRHLSSFILTSTLFLQRPRSILQYASNDYVSVPFMAGFQTPDSLIARRIPFVPSRYHRTSPDQPLCADMLTHSTLYVSHLWDVLWTFAYCVHVLLYVHAVTT